ncbi:bifunctional glutamate--cysteine ligase GshA/glutathione synthetase GshB [Erysipelothrix rhusiopathiae]|nr:bifunctional glutamate--cysteine ligase GshA/glutathione synthetase GshB [Erysipelothrix rhusiopathiae]
MKQLNDRLVFDGMFGIEKENLRVTTEGTLSKRNHSDFFNNNNTYISRDFSEMQVEMITKPQPSIQQMYDDLHNIQHVVLSTIQDELLWPQSNPAILPSDDEISLANLNEGDLKYREYLSRKYGNRRALISGIHFNFSFSENDLIYRFNESGRQDYFAFKNELYLKVLKYFIRDMYLYVNLFAASPVFHESFSLDCKEKANKTLLGDYASESLVSLRNSECGYKNKNILPIDYLSISDYHKSIGNMIKNGVIKSEKEIYEPVRLKFDSAGNIDYLEIRFIDINPLFFNGVSRSDLELIHMAAIYYSTLDDIEFSHLDREKAEINLIAMNSISGLKENESNKKVLLEQAKALINEMLIFMSELNEVPYDYINIFRNAKIVLDDGKESYAYQIRKKIEEETFVGYHLNIANKQKRYVTDNPLTLLGYKKLELSTIILIRSAIKKGYEFNVIDENENFIELIDPTTHKVEYIKQATKTSLDNYSSVLVMENKVLTKRVLSQNNISNPLGFSITSKEEALKLFYQNVLPESLVIKPNNTNFGVGITIFKNGYHYSEFVNAVDYALSFDETIILEEFISGKEYRFLIIGGRVEGILHRKSANVIGDGIHSIRELVDEKNKNPLRGEGYTKPLEKIKIDDVVINYLKKQNLSVDSVIAKRNEVYLRENSNISTGGDSIDFTDQVHSDYIIEAEKAAECLNVNITGVDMLIEDINEPASDSNHSIIELNFNPAIHIHCFPLIGPRKEIGDILIDEIFHNKNKKAP